MKWERKRERKSESTVTPHPPPFPSDPLWSWGENLLSLDKSSHAFYSASQHIPLTYAHPHTLQICAAEKCQDWGGGWTELSLRVLAVTLFSAWGKLQWRLFMRLFPLSVILLFFLGPFASIGFMCMCRCGRVRSDKNLPTISYHSPPSLSLLRHPPLCFTVYQTWSLGQCVFMN